MKNLILTNDKKTYSLSAFKYISAWFITSVLFCSHAIAEGETEFLFVSWAGKPLKVFASVPRQVGQKTPIVVVLHGMSRNAKAYRDAWHKAAMEENFIVVVPEFSAWHYPGKQYIFGNIQTVGGAPVPKEQWLFSALEPLFDHVRKEYGSEVNAYSLYGHSGGAQFGHRFLYFIPENRAERIVLANAGFYTMPVKGIDYPHGLAKVEVPDENLINAYAKRVIILLGDKDNNPQHKSLNKEIESQRQGPHRFARGHSFFNNSGFKASILLKVPFNWSLSIAPGVKHSNSKMVPFVTPFLLGGPLVVH